VIALIRLYSVDQSTQNQGASALSEAMALNVAHRRGFRWPILPTNIRFLRIKVRISVGQWIGKLVSEDGTVIIRQGGAQEGWGSMMMDQREERKRE